MKWFAARNWSWGCWVAFGTLIMLQVVGLLMWCKLWVPRMGLSDMQLDLYGFACLCVGAVGVGCLHVIRRYRDYQLLAAAKDASAMNDKPAA